MANTYSQIYIRIVFTVKYRQKLIPAHHIETLHKFMTGIVTKRQQKLLAIFAMPDYIHILVHLQPNISISDLVRDIKAGSSKFISDNNWIKGKFSWQNGLGLSHMQTVKLIMLYDMFKTKKNVIINNPLKRNI